MGHSPVHITLVAPCYNEADNIAKFVTQLVTVMDTYCSQSVDFACTYRIVIFDDGSTDASWHILTGLCTEYPQLSLIGNAQNSGLLRAQFYALMQVPGDIVIQLASDFQEPPELIPALIDQWKNTHVDVILAQKNTADEALWTYIGRSIYYYLLKHMSASPLHVHVTGFGLYTRKAIDAMRERWPARPYLRGLVSEVGLKIGLLPFHQPKRAQGKSKMSVAAQLEWACIGLTSHAHVPFRLMLVLSPALLILSFMLLALCNWPALAMTLNTPITSSMVVGSLSIILGLSGLCLLALACVGEYIWSLLCEIRGFRPITERERVNWPHQEATHADHTITLLHANDPTSHVSAS